MITIKKKNIFLSFRIGRETFAVSVQKALEVLENQIITKVPNVPCYVEGVINFRGKIIPVIDARIKFNLPRRSNDEEFVIIVFDLLIDGKDIIVGTMVDSLQNVISFDESNILAIPELGFNYNTGFIFGMIKDEKNFTVILDIDKVFSSEETNLINQVKEANKEALIEVVI